MGVNGKAKGSAYERWVCKQLSLWVSAGAQEDLYWRSALSGGRATVAAKSGKLLRRQAGDICAVSPEGHALTDTVYLECKFYRDLQLQAFLFDGKGKLAKFWLTAVKDAKRHQREPLLVCRQNRTPDFVVARPKVLTSLVGPQARTSLVLRSKVLGTVELYRLNELLRRSFAVRNVI